jgi:DNA-binding MarR family transcriptional regulator
MAPSADRRPEVCNCQALRQAARHVTQFYDRCLAPSRLRVTQFSLLARLDREGPLTIGTLAERMVMDRTTLGRTIGPLERDGLIAVARGRADRRNRELQLTDAGRDRLQQARAAWAAAQARFEDAFGPERTRAMRMLMRDLTETPLESAAAG